MFHYLVLPISWIIEVFVYVYVVYTYFCFIFSRPEWYRLPGNNANFHVCWTHSSSKRVKRRATSMQLNSGEIHFSFELVNPFLARAQWEITFFPLPPPFLVYIWTIDSWKFLTIRFYCDNIREIGIETFPWNYSWIDED